MYYWRPSHKCYYVISEIHGNYRSLEVIFNSILPLRKFKGQEDIIVFLGDYIDKDEGSYDVINALVNLKHEYGDRVMCLRGNHEDALLRALNGSEKDYQSWIDIGGQATINSYLKARQFDSIAPNRLSDLFPQAHIEFLKTLPEKFIYEDYCFFHGGFDINKPIAENSVDNFIYDYNLSRQVKTMLRDEEPPQFQDEYIFVGAHNYKSKFPFIYQNYMMLGGSAPARLFIMELNSMSISAVKRGKTRMYKYKL